MLIPDGGFNENSCHKLLCLNSCSQVGTFPYLGDTGKYGFVGEAVSLRVGDSSLPLGALCFPHVDPDVSSQLFLFPYFHLIIMAP